MSAGASIAAEGVEGSLGQRLRSARLRRGLSVRGLAAIAGCAPSLISQIETGKNQPSVGRLSEIARRLDVSADHLLGLPVVPRASSCGDPGVAARLESIGVGGSLRIGVAPHAVDLIVLYVVEGELTVEVAGEVWVLAVGSSLRMDPTREYACLNRGHSTARVLVGEFAASIARTRTIPGGTS